jgi:sugar diacid utilization regulator
MESVQAIAESLALRLRRSVAIDDVQMRLLAHTAHDEPVDTYRVRSVMRRKAGPVGPTVTEYALRFGIATATGPVWVPASEELGSLPRICVPVRCQNTLLGYLWLMDFEPGLTEAELELASRAADAAGEALFRQRLLDDLRRGHERELLRDLLHADQNVRHHAARTLVREEIVPEDAPAAAVVVAIGADGGDSRAVALDLALQRAQRRLTRYATLAMGTGTTGGVLLVAGPQAPKRAELAECAAALLDDVRREVPDGTAVRVGVGPAGRGLEDAAESHRCATEALRVAEAVPDMGSVVFWTDLGVYRLLIRLPLENLRGEAIPPGLRRLIDEDPSHVLLLTLETYLDVACNAATAVARLNIHRTSLYYRIGRIEEITGMSMRSGGDRLSLHLGIKLARLMGLLGGARLDLVSFGDVGRWSGYGGSC